MSEVEARTSQERGRTPPGWSVRRLGEFAVVATGNTPPTRDAANYGDDFPFVSPTDLGVVKYVGKTEKRLSKKGFESSRRFPSGTILFVSIGSTIGKCGIAATALTSNQQINAVLPSSSFSTDYVYYCLCLAAPRIQSLAGEQAVPIVNKTQFSETELLLPPLSEQRAIAAALNDVDALIGALDRLIAKKRDLKQAAMQQLLTGQTRLPGFSSRAGTKQTDVGALPGDWSLAPLKSVLSRGRLGGNYPNHNRENAFPLMKMGNVARGYFDVRRTEYVAANVVPDPKDRLRFGDVIFNTRNTLDLVGKVAIWRNEIPVAYYNSNLMRLEFNPELVCSNEYANYALNAESSVGRLRSLATGTTSVAAIYGRDLAKMPFIVPPLAEQLAIASVLSNMDAELVALAAQHEKTRLLKQGMMQELLTGRIRLV
jgi:type I restriction enzyme S subunit